MYKERINNVTANIYIAAGIYWGINGESIRNCATIIVCIHIIFSLRFFIAL